MKNELHDIRLIEGYLLGTLRTIEKQDFENRLIEDFQFKNLFEQQSMLLQGVNRIALVQSIKQGASIYSYRQKLKKVLIGIVALSILGLGAYWISTTNLHQTNPEPKHTKSIVLDTADKSEPNIDLIKDTIETANQNFGVSGYDKGVEKEPVIKAFELNRKAFQEFVINPNKDTSLLGKEGTVVNVKANTFAGNTTRLRLTEYYKMSDILTSNLSTEALNGEILETGGMIHLEAMGTNGKQLKPEKPIEIKFPYDEKKEGMKLFEGSGKEIVKWEEIQEETGFETEIFIQPEETIEEVEIFTIVEEMPLFPGCDNSESKTEKYGCSFSKMQIAIQDNFNINKVEKEAGSVYVRFIIDEEGLVENPVVVRTVLGGRAFEKEALEAVKKLPKMSPGKQRGKPVKVQFTVPIRMDIDGQSEIPLGSNGTKNRFKRKTNNEILDITFNKGDTLSKMENSSQSNIESLRQDALNYYVFSTTKLGWINCDRFTSSRYQKVNFALRGAEPNIPVRMIFKRIKSLMMNYPMDSVFSFSRVPLNEEVILFSAKLVDGKPHVAFHETTIDKMGFELVFKPVSIEELKALRERLNKLTS